MHRSIQFTAVLLVFVLFISGCTQENGNGTNDKVDSGDSSKGQHNVIALTADFNEDSAYAYIEKQVSFGPRVPGTSAHAFTGQWLIEKMRSFTDTVYIQDAKMSSKLGTTRILNIIGSINPKATVRVALAAHWDTRPHADEDPDHPELPADGANDGASGVGVLLEVARQLQLRKPEIGVDFILFDAEDGGSQEGGLNSWCLGSQYWSINKHIKDYDARFGILLDMVGAKDATFPLEAHSASYANNVLFKVWRTAQNMGYGDRFLNIEGSMITDDHLFMNEAGIPTIDIIHYDFVGGGGFGDYWHTHMDNMDIIHKPTLRAVGMTVLQVIYYE